MICWKTRQVGQDCQGRVRVSPGARSPVDGQRIAGHWRVGHGNKQRDPVSGKRPGMMDFVNRAKYDAWEKVKGTSSEDAMQQYIDKLEALK